LATTRKKDWSLQELSIWKEHKNDEVGHPKAAEVMRGSHFPFLDMKMTWSEEGDL
jgi:hypothetical protein